MRWNELSKKTIGIAIALCIIFAGTLGVLAVILIRQRGGDEIARIVRDAVESERITPGNNGGKVVADRLLVTFREDATNDARNDLAKRVLAKILGTVSDQPSTYIFSFSSINTARQLNALMEILSQSPDVIDTQMIMIE